MRISSIARATLAATILITATSVAQAGPIGRACNSSDRKASSPRLCHCIQKVANDMLDRSDQRLAAKFFKKPDMAQDIKMSDNRSHEDFWKKYKAFGVAASSTCS